MRAIITGYVALSLVMVAGASRPARLWAGDSPVSDRDQPRAKCTERLVSLLETPTGGEPLRLWIYFRDHGPFPSKAEKSISERSIERRRTRSSGLTDIYDLPVDMSYISAIRAHAQLRHVSRYFNAVSALVEPSGIGAIASLPFVERIDIVESYRRSDDETDASPASPAGAPETGIYGGSLDQLEQINVVPLLDLGFNGSGAVAGSDPVLVCVMDTGFRLDHEALIHVDVVAQYDFIQRDTVVRNEGDDHPEQDKHGTIVLGAIAGYHEGDLVGPAWGAQYLLAKTEIYDEEIEIEEDNWIAGIEWADSAGAEVVSSSLGYLDWYTPDMMDGDTPLCTRAADIAAGHGIVVVTAMGNEGAGGDTTLIAPADGDSVIAVGAVDRDGIIVSFSSRGPTADGRIKPDLVALGLATHTVEYPLTESYARYSGTSLSTPLVAGLCAQLLEILPDLTPISLWELLTSTSSRSETPDNAYGYGLPNGAAASGLDIGPTTIVLGGAYPNPFRSRTSFAIEAPSGVTVTARVYDCRGALVKVLAVDREITDGNRLAWDGTNAVGLDVATGVYFVRFTGRDLDRTIKVLLVR